MRKKILLATASTLIASLCSLASCGADKGYQGEVQPGLDTRGVTIDFWTGFGNTISGYLSDIVIPKFTEQTRININHTTKGGYDGLQKAINLAASQVAYPNIALGYPDHFAGYVASDIQLRLDDYVVADPSIPEVREDGFHEGAKLDLNDFYSYFLKENYEIEFKEDGTGYLLGLPFNKSTEVMVYNKTFFDNEYVKSLGIIVPETWDDLKTVGKKIVQLVTPAFGKVLAEDGSIFATEQECTTAGKKVLLNLLAADAETFFPFGYDSSSNFFITGVRQWGGQYTSVDKETGQGYIEFDTPETRQFLQFFKELAAEKIVALPSSFKGTSSYCSSYYTNFQCLMNIGSSAGLSNYTSGTFNSKAGYVSAITHVPYKDLDHKIIISQGTNLCMLNKGSAEEKLASWKALKWLASEGNGIFCSLTGYFPSCKAATNSEAYQKFLTRTTDDDGEPLGDNDVNMQNGAKYNSAVYDADGSGWVKFVDPGFNGSSTVRTEVGNLISEVLIDQADIDSTIATYKAKLADYVRD